MNLFENLQKMNESENHHKYKYVGNVYKNDLKTKVKIGEIKTPLYVVAKSIGGAYQNLIKQIVAGNQLFEIQNAIQIDKDNIVEVNEIPEIPNNISGQFESSYGMERYSYVGPVYRFNTIYANIKEPIYTVAKSYKEAIRNICFKLKEKYGFTPKTNLTIDENKVKRNNKVKELKKEPNNIETKIDDPKFNFDDPDRDEEYIVESILSFDDWFDENFIQLIKDFAEKYEISEDEVYDSEDFDEYANDEYEDYYKNTNRYLNDEDDVLTEDKQDIYEYKITFEFNIFDELEYDDSEQTATIVDFNDDYFDNIFDDENEVKEFEKWFNGNDDNISIRNIEYELEEKDIENFELIGVLNVTLNKQLDSSDEKIFANELIYYMFEGDSPTVKYHVSGTSYEDYWSYQLDSHRQRTVEVDYDNEANIKSYSNVNIQKIN